LNAGKRVIIYIFAKKDPMRAVVQKVSRASVSAGEEVLSSIGQGLLILLGIEDSDTEADITWLANKIVRLRVFDDEAGVMNRSVKDVAGDIIVVSQFTLHANTRKGNRPSYIRASKPGFAAPMYEKFVQKTGEVLGKKVGTGRFGAMMEVSLINDGPVTIIIDTKQKEL